MEGIYVSYDEKKRGNIEDAIRISNDEYLIWRHVASIKRKLKYPTKIIIRIKGQERYYQGNLLLVADYKAFNPKFIKNDYKHRPSLWKNTPEKEWKSVSFLTNLQAVKKPSEIPNEYFPQRPVYFRFKD